MRAGLALIAAFAFCVTPVVAQGKTKGADVGAQALEVLAVCERFASGDVLAMDDAAAKGWEASEAGAESPYVQSFNASKDLPGIGLAEMFVLLEDYPAASFGYCRMDVVGPQGSRGNEAIQAIQGLDRYEGQAIQTGDGSFASLAGRDDKNRLLLAHWSDDSFVIQLSILTPKIASEQ